MTNSLFSRKVNADVYGIKESAIEVVYPGVNTEVVTPSSRVPHIIDKCVRERKPVIFIPRGAQFWRRPEIVLQALKGIKIKDFVAVFTGGADYEVAALIKHAKAIGLSEKVLCVQDLSSEEINALYSHSSLVISIPKRQPFGMIPLEALVCGAPPVIFGSGGVSEVLRNGIDVVCIHDGDIEGLSNAIETLILEPETRRKIVSNGQRRVLEEFTSKRFVSEIKEKLQKLA